MSVPGDSGAALPPAIGVARGGGPPDADAKPVCRHCGAPLLDARMRASGFCCAGCSYVYRLVHEHGLAGYYQIKDEITAPADAAVFQPRDYAWLEAAQRDAEAAFADTALEAPPGKARSPSIPRLTLDVQGISCAGCVWLIERIFQQQPGARDIVVNPQYGTMRLRWVRGEFSAVEFARKLQTFGYLAGPAGAVVSDPESRGLVRRIGLCAAFALNVMLYSLPTYFGMERTFEWAGLFQLLNVTFGTLSVLVGGTYFLARAVRALRERAMHIDLPIAIGIAGAYLGSLFGWLAGEERFVYFDFVSAFILLMLVGRWAQVVAVERNRRRLLSQQPKPPRVRVRRAAIATTPALSDAPAEPSPSGDFEEVPPEQLRAGQTLALGAGQTLVVEAQLTSPEAAVSLASISGEAEPRIFRAGQRIPAGAVNVGRTDILLVAQQAWAESLLAQLLQAGERPGVRHALLERIVRGYVIGILIISALAGLGWWLGTGDALRTWAVVTAVLVVSCPCAIALAFPLADEMATVALRRRGVFVREGDLWPKLSRVRQIVFDKTGTLTLENPVLQNPEVLADLDPIARAALYILIRDNPHPVSQCLLENLLAAGPVNSAVDERSAGPIHETIGVGVEWGMWSLGRPGWRSAGWAGGAGTGDPAPAGAAGHDAELACEGKVVACFHFRDEVRSDARAEVRALQAQGFAVGILSGDRAGKVAAMAAELGLPSTRAMGGLTPQGKADWLDAHDAEQTLMLGDGANDSLAFDRALCRGTPVIHRGVLERKADFYYLGRGIGGLRALFDVDRIRRRTQFRILAFSIAYNGFAVGLALAGRMNPLVAAILMPASSLLTLLIVSLGMRPVFRVRG